MPMEGTSSSVSTATLWAQLYAFTADEEASPSHLSADPQMNLRKQESFHYPCQTWLSSTLEEERQKYDT